MQQTISLLAALVLTAVPAATSAATPAAQDPPRHADLVVKGVTASASNGQVTVSARVKNKGDKSAKPSQAAFYLSTDGTQSKDDAALSTASVGKIKAKKTKDVDGTFALPTGLAGGSYRVLACADSGDKVKERKENNNCKASKGSITVVAVTASAAAGGSVAVSAVSGGSCTGTTCTFAPGTGSVTFTPTAGPGYRFGAWSGTSCTGVSPGAGNSITVTNPTYHRACTATFLPVVTVSWTVDSASGSGRGAITATVSVPPGAYGSCSAAAQQCTIDPGVGTVTLVATRSGGVYEWDEWQNWNSLDCDGVESATSSTGSTMTFTNPTEDKGCNAKFEHVG